MRRTAQERVVEVVDDPARIDAGQWNALLDSQGSPTPFMRHEYLAALHASASAITATGWSMHFLVIREAGKLAAACPLYLKSHSYGEYVFDWAWADAYERQGLAYYPKLLGAVPFTPVPGTRLLARDAALRTTLLRAMEILARENGFSSAHVLYLEEDDQRAAVEAGWMLRSGVQFHWQNRHVLDAAAPPYADFAEFLASLQRDKRKKIQQERRKVRDAGVDFEVLAADGITPADWDFFYRCYTLTYRAHHSKPYLTREFFECMARDMPRHWLMFIAHRAGRRVASSLIALDEARGAAYGRYWGSTEHIDCLHFEACYYRPLAWCIEHRFRRFEGGAQGEHKMARGLLPVSTASAHWLAHPQFADAVSRFLEREGAGVEAYVDELRERNPFKGDG